MKYDVIVIGGGISGLSAVHRIKKIKSNCNVKLIEAKDRLGGRVFGKLLKTKNGVEMFDVGGQWVGRTQYHVFKLLEEFQLETYKQSTDGNTVVVLDNNQKFTIGDILKVSITSLGMAFDLIRGLKKMDDLCGMLNVEEPMLCPYAKEWDEITMTTATNMIFKTQACRKLVDISFLTIFGAQTSQLSFLYVLLYFRSGGGCAALLDSDFKGNAQEFKVKGGLYQLVQKLANNIQNENIQLSSPVQAIDMTGETCKIYISDGHSLECNYVILAIPPHLIGNITITPSLSTTHQQLLSYMHTGHLIKCIITYDTNFWLNKDLSGFVMHWPYYENACSERPVFMVFDATSSSGSPALLAFIGGKIALDYVNQGNELEKKIIASLTTFFGEKAAHVKDIVIQNWCREAYNGGCPTTFFSPGAISLYDEKQLRKSHHRLHFAGTETATIFRGFVDGAIQAGYRAADEILCEIDSSYRPADTVKFHDILSTKPEHYYRLPYYLLTCSWNAVKIGVLMCGIFTALKISHKWTTSK